MPTRLKTLAIGGRRGGKLGFIFLYIYLRTVPPPPLNSNLDVVQALNSIKLSLEFGLVFLFYFVFLSLKRNIYHNILSFFFKQSKKDILDQFCYMSIASYCR
jgi:hypothetical protein